MFRPTAIVLAATLLLLVVSPRSTPQTNNAARPHYPSEHNLIEVMFAAESSVRLRGGTLVDFRTNALDGVSRILTGIDAVEWSRICDVPEQTLDEMQSRGMANTGRDVYNLNNIYRLRFDDKDGAVDIWKLAADLEALPGVMLARPVPKPMPLPVPPDYDPLQGYNDPASSIPAGIDARYAWTLPGGDGTGVTICDLEYGWNYGHFDVTKAVGSQINTNVILSEVEHGTAVIGQLVADDNGWGTKGSCYGSSLRTCGTITGPPFDPTWNVPGALAVAIANLSAGDIILLEQQWDYTGSAGYVPIEWWMNWYPGAQTYNGVYAAIVNAVANGIHVVEAGGNGNINTDYMTWIGDSGAIIVGAGGAYSWNDLERLSFSSYGSRFNLQGWGQAVVTTGYGDLYNAEGSSLYYTGSFSGTSSASPIVTAAVACVQGYYLANISPTPLPPASMRALLMNTGTPQEGDPFNWGNIGPRPNLYAAIQTMPPPPREYGDAPEGALAYRASGIIGMFPTCTNVGPPGSFVQHANVGGCYFGYAVEGESDGNAGNCPSFSLYDADECQGDSDGDAGLLFPMAYTITPGPTDPVPCQATQLGSLGDPCAQAVWGTDVDIMVTNNLSEMAHVNVLADWDQNGEWGGAAMCGTTAALEHVLVNFPVPSGYTGPLSLLGPPPFLIGPNGGYVWTRFTISEAQVATGWSGAGMFNQGETCDYLLGVEEEERADYGDAPEGAIAYPATGVWGSFPTCVGSGAAGFVSHQSGGQLYFGPAVDLETEGNAGNCANFPPYDADECQSDGDAGLLFPTAYTIITGSTDPVPCQTTQLDSLGSPCAMAVWGTNVDIMVTNSRSEMAYVNVLMDWSQNGEWQGASQCPTGTAPERVLVNCVVPAGFAGPLSLLAPTGFRIGPNPGYVWTRFTVSEVPIPTAVEWTGEGAFEYGETEDFLLRIDDHPVGVEDQLGAVAATRLLPAVPNPFHGATTIGYELVRPGEVSVGVFDVAGRRIKALVDGEKSAGRHQITWDGRNDAGERVATGVYFVRFRSEGKNHTRSLILLR